MRGNARQQSSRSEPAPAAEAAGAYPRSRVVRLILIEVIRWGVHLGAVIGVFLAGVSWPAFAAFLLLGFLGTMGVTLGYHRYFAHRSFKTSRWFQFLLALWGATSLQRGPIWWSAVHRHHHAFSDTEQDWHSPRRGFWHAHMGWLASPRILSIGEERVQDWVRYPELRWLDVWYHLPSLVLIGLLAWAGAWLQAHHPETGATAWQMVVWGFFVKSTAVWQLSFSVNSMLHKWGAKRFDTGDDSRNSPWWLGILTLGDGYHNNHHRYPSAAQHGFYPGETDVVFSTIRLFEAIGLVWDVKRVPEEVLEEGRGFGQPQRQQA